MEKNKQKSKDSKEIKPLMEDLQGHKHDDKSFEKLMRERENRKQSK